MKTSNQLAKLTATETSRLYKSKELSPVEMTQAMLERSDTLNPELNAIYKFMPEQALEAAKASEQRWLKGQPLSPLDGITTTAKDALSLSGTPNYRGSAANLGDAKEDFDTACNARLKEAGAIFIGKTTMPDFGILASGYSSYHGVTRNPWDLSKNTGGSSSGTAAVLAAGINSIAVGTDIVGSIRLPASFCGLFGLKPTQGRVPYVYPNAPTLVAGPMSRTVEDSALLMNCISRPDKRDFTALPFDHCDYTHGLENPLSNLKLGYLGNIGFGPDTNPEVDRACRIAANDIANIGYSLQEIPTPFQPDDELPAERFYQTRCFNELSKYPLDKQKQTPIIYEWSSRSAQYSATDLYTDMNQMLALREKTQALFEHIDYLIMPAVPYPAFEAELAAANEERLFDPWANNFLFNMTEQPAISINCGYTESGLPIGLQIIGPRFSDAQLLRLARSYEKIRPQQKPFPFLND